MNSTTKAMGSSLATILLSMGFLAGSPAAQENPYPLTRAVPGDAFLVTVIPGIGMCIEVQQG